MSKTIRGLLALIFSVTVVAPAVAGIAESRAPLSPEDRAHQRPEGTDHSRASVDPVTLALIIESVTPITSVGMQPETSYGAGLPAAKRGAIVTPDGRL